MEKLSKNWEKNCGKNFRKNIFFKNCEKNCQRNSEKNFLFEFFCSILKFWGIFEKLAGNNNKSPYKASGELNIFDMHRMNCKNVTRT